MTSAERDAVCNLGWTRESWDAGDDGTPFDTAWQMLSPAQKRAAELLSYSPRDFGGGDAAPQPADDNWVEGYDEFAAAAELAPSISRPVEKVREKHLASPEMSVAEVQAAVRAEAPALLVGDRVEIWSKSVSAQPSLRLLQNLREAAAQSGGWVSGQVKEAGDGMARVSYKRPSDGATMEKTVVAHEWTVRNHPSVRVSANNL